MPINHTKHFQYHQNYGDKTEECGVLKDRTEELIQAGQLKHFVQRDGCTSKRE